MNRRGHCPDNPAMESWLSTVKFELGETFRVGPQGQGPAVRLHRGLLQPAPTPFVNRLPQPCAAGEALSRPHRVDGGVSNPPRERIKPSAVVAYAEIRQPLGRARRPRAPWGSVHGWVPWHGFRRPPKQGTRHSLRVAAWRTAFFQDGPWNGKPALGARPPLGLEPGHHRTYVSAADTMNGHARDARRDVSLGRQLALRLAAILDPVTGLVTPAQLGHTTRKSKSKTLRAVL